MWIVRFEMVSPVDHGEYYEDGSPLCEVQDVLPEDFKAVAVTHQAHPDAVAQFRGLKELCRRGELIRNVKLREVIDLQPTDWTEVDNILTRQYRQLQAEVADAETYSGGQDQEGEDQHAGRHSPQDSEDRTPGELPDPTRQ